MHWLIDCENVGVVYKGFVDVGHDIVTLVYSKGYQPKKTSDIVNLTCFESAKGGQSADMAIAALLGGMVIANPDDEYVIVSNKRDFKPLCLTMVANGYHIKQVSCCYEASRSNPVKSSFSKAVGCGGAVLGPVVQEPSVQKAKPAVPVRALNGETSRRPRGLLALRKLFSTLRTPRR